MARSASNPVLNKVSGQIGKQIVLKQYGDKTVVTQYPDMSRVKPSPLQKYKRNVFKEAVAYARSINSDRLLKTEYLKKVKSGESVYHYALKEYLKQNK
jgi:hypothetical protein